MFAVVEAELKGQTFSHDVNSGDVNPISGDHLEGNQHAISIHHGPLDWARIVEPRFSLVFVNGMITIVATCRR